MAKKKTSKASKAADKGPALLLRDSIAESTLKEFDRSMSKKGWEFAIEGHWYDSPYHSGFVAYYVREFKKGVWLLKSLERNAILDGVTEEDVEAGALNDDQIQAMWGMTLEEAQDESFEEIVAVWGNAPAGTTSKAAAARLYEFICKEGGKDIDEPGNHGLLAE
jgi:hypothetical protein